MRIKTSYIKKTITNHLEGDIRVKSQNQQEQAQSFLLQQMFQQQAVK